MNVGACDYTSRKVRVEGRPDSFLHSVCGIGLNLEYECCACDKSSA